MQPGCFGISSFPGENSFIVLLSLRWVYSRNSWCLYPEPSAPTEIQRTVEVLTSKLTLKPHFYPSIIEGENWRLNVTIFSTPVSKAVLDLVSGIACWSINARPILTYWSLIGLSLSPWIYTICTDFFKGFGAVNTKPCFWLSIICSFLIEVLPKGQNK